MSTTSPPKVAPAMPSTTTTKASNRESRDLHDPVSMTLSTLPKGRRTERRVRTRDGEIQTRMVLERVASDTTTSTTGDSSVFYTFKKLCYHEPNKGVSVFLATPTMSQEKPTPRLISCGPLVVIKIVQHPSKCTTRSADDPYKEIAAMQLLNNDQSHPNVIHLIDAMQDDDFVYMILPYLPGGDLFTKLQATATNGQALSEATAATYLKQVGQG